MNQCGVTQKRGQTDWQTDRQTDRYTGESTTDTVGTVTDGIDRAEMWQMYISHNLALDILTFTGGIDNRKMSAEIQFIQVISRAMLT